MFFRRRAVIAKYAEKVQQLKEEGRRCGLSDEEIEFTLRESMNYVQQNEYISPNDTNFGNANKYSWIRILIGTLFLLGCLYGLNFYKPAHNFVERNIQEVIYPFMKLYRRITLPLVQAFPYITEWYDESCLLENPYFQVTEMDCWPCENVRFVINLTDSIDNAHIGLPFIQKVQQSPVTVTDLHETYLSFKDVIDSSSPRVQSNCGWTKIDEVLGVEQDYQLKHGGAHVTWRINRMEAGRVLRNLLRPPQDKEIPPHATSIGIERFLFLDGPNSPYYALPSSEGANVFLKQLSGQRLIVLEPSRECRQTCRRVSLLLKESHILWYNWWYWRPRSFPVANSSVVSISLLGSSA